MESFLNYRRTAKGAWSGRIDDPVQYSAFRWHQWVTLLDINDFHPVLNESERGICFIGFCSDEGVRRNLGRTGAAKGPESIRKEMSNLPCSFSQRIRLFDAGDIYVRDGGLEAAQEELGKAVALILSEGLFPIVLGGGHETTFGNYLGVARFRGADGEKNEKLGIINFDAHFDLRPYPNGATSGSMFRQIADLCEKNEERFSYYCLGIQKHCNTVELFNTAKRLHVKYALAKDIVNGDDWLVLENLDRFIEENDRIYVTVCSDVFSTAYAPGVSAAQCLGLDPERVIRYIKYIVRSGKLTSFDICEVLPRFDLDNVTANLASVIIYSVVSGMDA